MQDCNDRPLIFIGHCFGGLVIQQVCSCPYTIHVFSCKRQALTTDGISTRQTTGLFDFTVGLVFLGTPHSGTVTFTSRGISTKDILTVIALNSELRHEPKVLSDLESEYGTLLDVSQHFLDLCRSSNLKVINFFEQRASKVGKQIGRDDLLVLIFQTLLYYAK
jgi:hypothetical protein